MEKFTESIETDRAHGEVLKSKYEVRAYFMDIDEDPSTPFEEEDYDIVADSESEALSIARNKAYASRHSIGTNLSVDVEIN